MENRKIEILSLIRSLLDGSVEAEDVLKRWPAGIPINGAEESLVHEVGHFADDTDLRKKDMAQDPIDTKYRDFQLSKIRESLIKFENS